MKIYNLSRLTKKFAERESQTTKFGIEKRDELKTNPQK
jgi:hypothetical protein